LQYFDKCNSVKTCAANTRVSNFELVFVNSTYTQIDLYVSTYQYKRYLNLGKIVYMFLMINWLEKMFQGLSPELSAMLLAAIIGGYTLIGGLGATFYVSYFNTGSIFILILLLIVEVNTKRWGGMFDFEIFW